MNRSKILSFIKTIFKKLILFDFQLPIVPSHLMSSAVQINSNNTSNNNNFRDNSNNRKKSDVSNASSDASSRDAPQHLLQFNHQRELHQQIAMGKARIPYGSPYSSSSSSSGGEVINLTKNKTSGGSFSTFAGKNAGGKSPKSQSGGVSGGASTNSNRVFVGTTSILDNLLKNPRTHLEAAIAAAAAAAAASAHNAHNNDGSDNNDMVQYEAEGYADAQSSPHNLTAAHLIQQQRQDQQDRSFYYSPGSAGHPAFTSSGNDDDDNNGMEMTMTEDNTPIPAHLLEPNVEYRVPKEYADRYGLLHNPLADLAKVAAASIQHQPATVGKRGSRKNQQQQQQQQAADGNGVDDITSTGKQANTTPAPTPKKAKKNPDSIICDICGKKFSNAYNLRVSDELMCTLQTCF